MKFFSFCCDIFSHFELSPTEASFPVDCQPGKTYNRFCLKVENEMARPQGAPNGKYL
jgi:hypothetical protein